MNIAIFNTFSHTMSTGKIAFGLYNYLKKSNNVYLIYGRPDEEKLDDENIILMGNKLSFNVHKIGTRLFGRQGAFSLIATNIIIKKLKKKKINVVYLLNIHGNYVHYFSLFRYLIKNKIKVIYLMLDEYAFLGKCAFSFGCEKYLTRCQKCPQVHGYPRSLFFDNSKQLFQLKKRAYKGIKDITFAGVPYTVRKAKQSVLLSEYKVYEIDEGIDLRNVYYPRDIACLKKKHKINDDKIIILTVAPYTNKRKGGQYFLNLAERFRENHKYVFVHVGYDGDLNLCPTNYIPINYISDQDELARYYSLADLFVCTSIAETVADTCLEALACGTRILGFNASGMPDCADDNHGAFVDIGDIEALVKIINDTNKKTQEDILSNRQYAVSRYDSEKYFEKLSELAFERDI